MHETHFYGEKAKLWEHWEFRGLTRNPQLPAVWDKGPLAVVDPAHGHGHGCSNTSYWV